MCNLYKATTTFGAMRQLFLPLGNRTIGGNARSFRVERFAIYLTTRNAEDSGLANLLRSMPISLSP